MIKIFPLLKMGLGEAAATAIFGYLVVFAGLLILMILLYIMAAVFKSRDKKAESAAPAVTAKAPKKEKQLPVAPGSAGHIKIFDVPDKEAAMVMAVVAYNMQKPLNELHFISIKEVNNDEV